MRESVMKSENWDRSEILKIDRNNLISISIFTFHHDFPHFDGKSDFREKRQISTLPADFRDFAWVEFPLEVVKVSP